MTTTMNLDDISTALEQAVKSLRAGAATPTTKRMTLDQFMTFALTQIQKAAKDEPAIAKRRLASLKRSVDDVIAAVAKMSAEDTESEDVGVEVTTAFAPTKADGDTPMDDLTTAAEQSSTEVDVETVTAASGDSAFAENLGQVAKSLQKLNDDLGATTGDPARARAKKRRDSVGEDGHRGDGRDREAGGDRERDPDGWPLDLASDEFLKGETAAENDPIWGYDPAGVAAKGR